MIIDKAKISLKKTGTQPLSFLLILGLLFSTLLVNANQLKAFSVNPKKYAGGFPSCPIENPHLMLNGYWNDPLQVSPRDYFQVKDPEAVDTCLYILQYDGPVDPETTFKLMDQGIKIRAYLPQFAYLVEFPKKSNLKQANIPGVRWFDKFFPEYKIGSRITMTSDSSNSKTLKLGVVSTSALDDDYTALTSSVVPGHLCYSTLSVPMNQLEDLMNDSRVLHFNLKAQRKIMNNRGRKIVGVETDDTITNGANFWNTPIGTDSQFGGQQFNTGRNIVYCIGDTGLDSGDIDSLSEDLTQYIMDPEADDFPYLEQVSSDDYNRVIGISDYVNGDAVDYDGHGTHVAGTILGNGYNSYIYGDKINERVIYSGAASGYQSDSLVYTGCAPEGQLIFQALGDEEDGSIADVGNMTLFANEADIYNESWGSSLGEYDDDAAYVDAIVWARLGEDYIRGGPQKNIFFAAGNDGADRDVDGIIDYYSLSSQATSKNVISVGASESDANQENLDLDIADSGINADREGTTYGMIDFAAFLSDPIYSDGISDNRGGIAAFSSRGPTPDYRVKPDIVAPGTNIVSILAGEQTPFNSHYDGTPDYGDGTYTMMSGTSMASPTAAGAAGILKEYFAFLWKEQGQSTRAYLDTIPSYGMKALLLCLGDELYPGQYDTYPADPSGTKSEIPFPGQPNPVEGWGRLDIGNYYVQDGGTQLHGDGSVDVFFSDPTSDDEAKNGLGFGESIQIPFKVERTYNSYSNKYYPLKIVVAWNDYPGLAGTGGLVNDLDMFLEAPNGLRFFPSQFLTDDLSYLQISSLIELPFINNDAVWDGTDIDFSNSGYAAHVTFEKYPCLLKEVSISLQSRIDPSYRDTLFCDVKIFENSDPENPGDVLYELQNYPFVNTDAPSTFNVTLPASVSLAQDCLVAFYFTASEFDGLVDTNTTTPPTYRIKSNGFTPITTGNVMVSAKADYDTSIVANHDSVANMVDFNSYTNGYYFQVKASEYPARFSAVQLGLNSTFPTSTDSDINIKVYGNTTDPGDLGQKIYEKTFTVNGITSGFKSLEFDDLVVLRNELDPVSGLFLASGDCLVQVTFLDNHLKGLIDTDVADSAKNTWRILSNGGYEKLDDGNFMVNANVNVFTQIENEDWMTNYELFSDGSVFINDLSALSAFPNTGWGFYQVYEAPSFGDTTIQEFEIEELNFPITFNSQFINPNDAAYIELRVFENPETAPGEEDGDPDVLSNIGTLLANYDLEIPNGSTSFSFTFPTPLKIRGDKCNIQVIFKNDFDYRFPIPEVQIDLRGGAIKNNVRSWVGFNADPVTREFQPINDTMLSAYPVNGGTSNVKMDVKINYKVPRATQYDEFDTDKYNNVVGIYLPQIDSTFTGEYILHVHGYNIPVCGTLDASGLPVDRENEPQQQFAIAIAYGNFSNPKKYIQPVEPPVQAPGEPSAVGDWSLFEN